MLFNAWITNPLISPLANKFLGLVFLNVIERDKIAMQRGSGYLKEEEVKLKETANIRFIDWAENVFELGLEVGAYMEVSKIIPEKLKVVKKEYSTAIEQTIKGWLIDLKGMASRA